MTDQHRATPEQWAHQDHWTREHRSTASCILELRARVEALEAAQQDKLDRLIALDRDDQTPGADMTELRAASAEAQGLAILSWSEERQPCEECRYNHCIAETPFGRFLISWKGWKDHPAVTADETPFGDWFECWNSVEEAKSECQSEYNRRLALAPLSQPQPELSAASADLNSSAGLTSSPEGLVKRVALTRMNPPLDEDDLKYARADAWADMLNREANQ